MKRFTVLAALLAGLLIAFLPAASAGNGPKSQDLHVQLLAFNDFHGQLDLPTSSSARVTAPDGTVVNNVGGMQYMATWIHQLAQTNPNTFVLSAGDNIGASPLISGLFHDEPTILALNAVGTDFSAVGNHEFDEGLTELLRMQNGGCGPEFSCADGTTFPGAAFQYLAANVFQGGTDQTIFPPYKVVKIGNTKIAFVGVSFQDTPSIVLPSAVAGLDFGREAATVNKVVRELRDDQGVRAFVVLLHDGGGQSGPGTTIDSCLNQAPGFVSLIDSLDPLVDVVVSGHTHNAYVCTIGNKLVTSAASFGRLVTDIDLTIDHQTKDVSEATAHNQIVYRSVEPDPTITALMNHYLPYEAPIANRVVGSVPGPLVRAQNAAGESPLGDVIADAQLADTAAPELGGAVVAVTNPGGIRADLSVTGDVTYGNLFTIQPFGNVMNVVTLTGAQIYAALEQQWSGGNAASPKVLQISHTLAYTWDAAQAPGSRIVPGSVEINGVPVTTVGLYRVAMNNFLATGGDNFSALGGGTDLIGGDVDVDALVKYFEASPSISAPPLDRITRLN